MFATQYATQSAANAAIIAAKGKPRVTHYAAGHISKATREEYWTVKAVVVPLIEASAPVRSERHVYTPSGKKRTSKQICLALFRKCQTKSDFIAAAAAKGVKQITAVTYFDDIKAGRIAA